MTPLTGEIPVSVNVNDRGPSTSGFSRIGIDTVCVSTPAPNVTLVFAGSV